MEPINELDLVLLTRDLPAYGLVHGDIGTAVYLHTPTDFEVEFCSGDGTTVALLTLTAQDVMYCRVASATSCTLANTLPHKLRKASEAQLQKRAQLRFHPEFA